jgi:hypothetical protein
MPLEATGLERLAKAKHNNLFRRGIGDDEKKFHDVITKSFVVKERKVSAYHRGQYPKPGNAICGSF